MSVDAGWYPLPGDPGTHGYWDGTAWTGQTRPAAVAAAAASAPATPATPAPTAPPAGFYRDNHDPRLERWWDGTRWTDATRPADVGPDREDPDTLTDRLHDAYTDNKDLVHGAAGAALAADSVLGIVGGNGIFSAIKGVMFGVALTVVAFFMGAIMAGVPTVQQPVPVTATVTAVGPGNDSGTPSRPQGKTCQVTVEFTTSDGRQVTTTPTSSSSLQCSYTVGQTLNIEYDKENPSVIRGVEPAAVEGLLANIHLVFAGVGILVVLANTFTVILRATELGAGIALITRARRRDRERRQAKAARKLSR